MSKKNEMARLTRMQRKSMEQPLHPLSPFCNRIQSKMPPLSTFSGPTFTASSVLGGGSPQNYASFRWACFTRRPLLSLPKKPSLPTSADPQWIAQLWKNHALNSALRTIGISQLAQLGLAWTWSPFISLHDTMIHMSMISIFRDGCSMHWPHLDVPGS